MYKYKDTSKRKILWFLYSILLFFLFLINVKAQENLEKSRLLFGSNSTIKMITFDKSVERNLGIGDCPRWSPDGRKIVFSYKGNIFIMNEKGNILEQLTDSPSDDRSPNWSPDGKSIVFSSNRDGRRLDLYVINIETKILRRLTETPGENEFAPFWSPDGTKIVYGRGIFSDHIYIMDSDGRNSKDITPDSISGAVTPVFSPDGKKIAFAGRRKKVNGIFTITSSGKELKGVIEKTGVGSLVYSPDGKMIAFRCGRDIYVVNLLTGKEARFLKASGDEWLYPSSWAWPASAYSVSPEGKIASMWGEIKSSLRSR